jgi:hypothetical protein
LFDRIRFFKSSPDWLPGAWSIKPMRIERVNLWNRGLCIAVLIFGLGIGECREIALGDLDDAMPSSASAKRQIDRLSSPKTTAEEMEEAEAQLQRMAPGVVLPLLVPKIAQGMPGWAIWNGRGSAKGDADAPPEWRAFYSHHRVWDHVTPKDVKLTAHLLAKHLSTVKTSKEQAALLSQMEVYWDDTAEKSVASIMRDFRDGQSPWQQAARCLMQHKKEKYYEEIKHIVKQLPIDTWKKMNTKASTVQLLLSERATAYRRNEIGALDPVPLPQLDSELLAIGFELLKAMEGHKRGFGYFLALDLGDYVGQTFQPNRKDGNYDGKNGLKEEFYSDCSRNALNWWEENKQNYAREP